jgi:heptosyltransferase III
MSALALPEGARILVVALRRLGDVLLTTPLIRSLRAAFPAASIDALVFAGTEGVLAGNPDLAAAVVVPARPSAGETLAIARKLWRRYDLAVSTQSGDRPTFFACVAAPHRIGPVSGTGLAAMVKRAALGRAVEPAGGLHRVDELLRLADALGIARHPEVVCPVGPLRPDLLPAAPYAVIHAAPMFRYKRWTEAGFRALARELGRRGLELIATGGPGAEERAYLDALWRDAPVRRLDGTLAWPELAALIASARLYVGPDTSVTHLAAASGCPTVALYGPTDPRLWGPWPQRGLGEPWAASGTIQRRGNVWLVQTPLPCMPCQLEGCARRLDSHSRCLDEMALPQVLRAVDAALSTAAAAVPPS